MIERFDGELVVRIPSGSPVEDQYTYIKAIINSLKHQRFNDLPMDMEENNYHLLTLLEHLLPDESEVAELHRFFERKKKGVI